MLRPALVLLVLLVTGGSGAGAIVVRHDLDPALYLADPDDFPAVGQLDHRVEAVLIDPVWALTAAHTVETLSTLDRSFVRFGDRCYRVESIVIHPEWEEGWPRLHALHDLALLRLDRPVEGIAPLPLYEGRGELERVVTLVGRGRTGNGRDGLDPERDHHFRRATTRIDLVTDTGLYSVFQDPADATELEGAAGPGDSGGPALLRIDDRWRVAGISSASTGVAEISDGRYGTLDFYARVSTFVPWIRDVLAGRGAGRAAWSPPRPVDEGIPGDTLATTLLEALDAGSAAALAAFHRSHGPPGDDSAGWAERVARAVLEPRGRVVPRSVTVRGEREVRVLFDDADAPGDRFSLTLVRGPDGSRFDRLYMKPERDPGLPSRCEQSLPAVREGGAPDSSAE